MEGKTYCRHSRAGKHVVLYRIAASLSGEFYSDLFLDRFRFTSGKGRTWKKEQAKEVLYGALLLGISSFCFGGALYVAETFRYIPGIFVKMAVFLILWMLLYLYTETDHNRQRICEVSLWQCGKNRKVKALYDTGNRLREPYKKRPVNIIEYEAAKELLDGKENVFLIPYRTVSGSGEMLRGIVFDRMIVSKGRKTEIYEHPVIALTGERVSSDGSYQMILHPDNRKNQEEKDYV